MRIVRCLVTAGPFALAVAASLGVEEASATQDEGPLVVVLAGQSNMVGLGSTEELDTQLALLPANVTYYFNGEQTLVRERPRFGPEVTLAHDLAAAMPDRQIVLVKAAVGGASLLAWAPQWDSAQAARTGNAQMGPLYRGLIQSVEDLEFGARPEFGAVLWMQGERDARFAEVGPEYGRNLRDLISAFRRDLGEPELPFILGLVNPPRDRYPAAERVREAQRAAAVDIPNVRLIPTDDLTKLDDNLHYDTAGVLELGRRFAAALLSVRGGG